jgi:beta-N-acetylhexosaminidase
MPSDLLLCSSAAGAAACAARLSRRQLLAWGGSFVAASLLAACQAPPVAQGSTPAPTPVLAPVQPAETLPAAALPTVTPATPLAAKLGQMIMVGFRGLSIAADAPIVADIVKRNVGSVVLFSYDVALASWERNIAAPAQAAQLTAELQALAPAPPLLIAADQEGGMVARLSERFGFPATVSAQALGERGDPAYTYAQAESMAKTLAAAGVNHNLAPVVDVNTNPLNPVIGGLGRSFSSDPAVVVEQARAFIQAHHAHGVTTTLKHFPGHGSSQADSHLGLVDVSATWQPLELEPYRALIGEGLADAVMTAHVFNAQLDATWPATLSRAVITGLLREELGYDGVVITDDMNMGAITAQYGFEQAAVLAVQAGADMLAYGNNLVYDPAVAQRAIAALLAAVEHGELSEARIDESYRRITALKQRHSLSKP